MLQESHIVYHQSILNSIVEFRQGRGQAFRGRRLQFSRLCAVRIFADFCTDQISRIFAPIRVPGFLHRSDFPDFCTDQLSRIFAPIRFPGFLHRSEFPEFCTDQISRIFAPISFPGFLHRSDFPNLCTDQISRIFLQVCPERCFMWARRRYIL